MRPASRIFMLPLVLLALVLQAGASVAAARAQAAALDPFASIPICSPDKAAQSRQDGPAPAGHHGDNHCGICLVGAVAHPPLLAVADAVYPDGLTAAAELAPVRHALPRGPPHRSPNARAPPAHA